MKKQNIILAYLAVACFFFTAVLLLPGSVQADNCFTISSGNWSTVDWSCGHVPGPGDDADISFDFNMNMVTITADVDVSVTSLSLAGTTFIAGDKTIKLSGTEPIFINGMVVFQAGTSTVVLGDGDSDLLLKGWEATTFNNLIMSPLTNPHTVTIQIPMAVNGTFISGSSATNRVSFVKVASSDVTNAVTSYYCASNGGISNIDCVPGGPDAPSDFSAAAVSQTQIDLSWTCTAADETGFKIFRDGVLIDNIEGPVSGETWDNTTAAPDAVSYSDTGLTADTTYNYEIKTTVLGTDSTGVTASATTQSAASSLTVEMTYLFNVNNTEPGKYVPLVAYIKNIGTEALSATALVEFYVDGPDGFTADPAGTASAAGLKAGYSMNAYLNWKIPETAPGGVYTYTAQAVDGADALSEFSSGMNFNVASIAAYTAEVLRIMPASATDPAPATLKVLVRNKDTAALTGTVKFYVDSTEVGTAAITNLAAGRYFWYTYSWDTTGQGGSHTYNAQVFNSSDAAISKVSSSTGITVY